VPVVFDVTDRDAVVAGVSRAKTEFGGILANARRAAWPRTWEQK
jgi:hypothetical protein